MKRSLSILIVVLLFSITLAGYFSCFVGLALSGAAFPYLGVYYNVENFKIGGSLGFIMGPDEKKSGQWYYMFSPAVEVAYFLTENFSVSWDARALVVIPYQSEQLYLTGPGAGYSFRLWEGALSLKIHGELILPISAGEKAWSRDMTKFPVPFIEGEYEFTPPFFSDNH